MALDETKETQDTSSEDTKDTSEKEPETFTEETQKEAVRKARSDTLAEAGRLKKSVENSQKAVKAANDRIEQMIKDSEDAELKAASGDEERTSAVKERQLRRKAESELAQANTELNEKKEELETANEEKVEATKEQNAREIATRLGKDPKMLTKLAKFTDGSTEAIEDVAKELPNKGDAQSLKVDSGKTTGGSAGIPTNMGAFKKWIADMSQGEYEKRKTEIDEVLASGKIK